MATILVLSDQLDASGILIETLEKLRHKIVEAHSVPEVLSRLEAGDVDIVFIDGDTKSESGIQSLAAIKKKNPSGAVSCVVVTSQAKSNDVIEAMKLGAFDHLSKPLSVQELESVINRTIAKPRLSAFVNADQSSNHFLVGLSPVMRNVEKLIGMAAASDATVLIVGETGTGKDTIARTIHRHSRHKEAPLTVIDCTAVPEDYGSFQSLLPGSQGTVILDEIGDLNAQMQAMLVRALKEAPLEASFGSVATLRLIATTQYDLINMVNEKRFREDLYYRLNVLPIALPPLRERGSDILALAETFLHQAHPDAPKRLSSAASKLMLDYEWPGNVRELQNLMYHLSVVVRSAVIEVADLGMLKQLPNEMNEQKEELDYHNAMAALEKQLLVKALKDANGSRSEAARLLGINRQLLYAKLKAHGLMG
jgi:two-component system, NtrC family, response regulator